ncbi:MAG: Flp family type IVb pilin [Hyphomicrobiales bacterium]|nr:Flp family type IVb pilin [Hyphomicrobiales bacterium]
MKPSFLRFARDASGATSIEYALIASSISILIIAAVGSIGIKLDAIFVQIESLIP